MADNKDKSVLIIDDIQTARASLQITMSNLDFGRITTVGSVKEAMEAIGARSFDVILCDYFMGDAADGQQFLEFLRSNDVIKSSTIFVMVTAEQGYTHVMTAAECAPDDYLVKPFTGAAILARLERLFDRNEVLTDVFRLFDQKNYDETVIACNKVLEAKSRFSVDAMRIKGEALVYAKRSPEAIDHYERIVMARDLPWAKLGLARAYADNGQMDKAESVTRSILRDNPKYMAAYDFLAKVLKKINKKKEALAVLQNATALSPKSVTRQRVVGNVALEIGDLNTSEAAMLNVIARNRNSPMKQASDYATLSNIMLEKDDPVKALSVIKEAQDTIKSSSGMDKASLSSLESLAHKRNGNEAAAKQALKEALMHAPSSDNLPESLSLSLARACLENNEMEKGFQLMKNLVQMNPDDTDMQASVKQAMLKAGIDADNVKSVIDSSLDEVLQINNKGVLLARNGEFEEAGQLLRSAAKRVPSNQQFVSNAAAILLADLEKNGLDYTKLHETKALIASLKDLNQNHTKLPSLLTALERLAVRHKLDLNS